MQEGCGSWVSHDAIIDVIICEHVLLFKTREE